MAASWLALMIGNSRLHWAWFVGTMLQRTWDTPHLSSGLIADLIEHRLYFAACLDRLTAELPVLPDFLSSIPAELPLWIASVVPAQTSIWQVYDHSHGITLEHIAIAGLYPTLGIDRALAGLGAATVYGCPNLVIDAGTALSFTGLDPEGTFVGGAILPGLGLQLRSLAVQTAALPNLDRSSQVLALPPYWATNTEDAIWSGVLYGLLATLQMFIATWQQRFTGGAIVLTGGDAALLIELLKQHQPKLASCMTVDPQIIFWGMRKAAMPT